MVHGLVKSLVMHGELETTLARAREVQRLADRLITLGKAGDLHARRQAFRILQNRTLVKQLFGDIAPRFVDIAGGYTRVTRLALRRGDGAQQALLALTRLPAAAQPAKPAPAKAAQPAQGPSAPTEEPGKKPKGLFEGLRDLWKRNKKKGGPTS
jgi:large subunit ribosomal protein L17